MHYWTLLIHALPYAWGVLSERLVGILAGGQHSALVVVVACFYSFKHSSPNLCPALYLVHVHYLAYLHLPAQAGGRLDCLLATHMFRHVIGV